MDAELDADVDAAQDAEIDAAQDAGSDGGGTGVFPPVDDVWADGPYTPITVNNTGPASAYTLFYPQELAPDGALNPILSWGNGAATNPSLYPNLLPHLASHGFVIIAANSSYVTGADIVSGIDWLIEQNQTPASPFYQKLDQDKVAAFGYSLGALEISKSLESPMTRG
jgi:predicted dienelactone hydrolase